VEPDAPAAHAKAPTPTGRTNRGNPPDQRTRSALRRIEVDCTGPDSTVPRFTITTGDLARIEIWIPELHEDALTFLTATIDACQQLHDQITNVSKS
jgi:hypothetical protein